MKMFIALVCMSMIGCGYSSTNNEMVAQPKKIHHTTPILCHNYTELDVSMGVMRNGSGSMSTEDVLLTVNNDKDQIVLQKAIDDGKLVKIHYDEFRFAVCIPVEGAIKTEDQKKQDKIDELKKQLDQLQSK
jgi:hypothetical protein